MPPANMKHCPHDAREADGNRKQRHDALVVGSHRDQILVNRRTRILRRVHGPARAERVATDTRARRKDEPGEARATVAENRLHLEGVETVVDRAGLGVVAAGSQNRDSDDVNCDQAPDLCRCGPGDVGRQ